MNSCDQTVNIERVQAVDANTAKVLASQVVAPGGNVNVLAGPGNGKITVDLSSLPQYRASGLGYSTSFSRSKEQ